MKILISWMGFLGIYHLHIFTILAGFAVMFVFKYRDCGLRK